MNLQSSNSFTGEENVTKIVRYIVVTAHFPFLFLLARSVLKIIYFGPVCLCLPLYQTCIILMRRLKKEKPA
jgi:hypothetical protein